MSKTTKVRKPGAFSLDDPRVDVAEPQDMADDFVFVEHDASLPAVLPPNPPKRRWRWGMALLVGTGGLALLALGVGIASLVEDLFDRSEPLGWAGIAFGTLAALSLLVIVAREVASLMRLASVDAIREQAVRVIASDDRAQGQKIVAHLVSLTRSMPRLARGRAQIESHKDDIIDGRDLVRLAERELMAPLDAQARSLIAAAARRVSVVTAVSPRAAIDLVFVFINALNLVRRLALLYGTRPGTFGLMRLIRHTVAHLTLTGGIAATDSLIQQLVGHGLAAKLSARLGEGVLNGLLTARLGIAAMEVTRPLPFSALPEPRLNDLAGHLLKTAPPDEPPGRPSGHKAAS